MLSSTTFPTMADRLFPPDDSVSHDHVVSQDSQMSVTTEQNISPQNSSTNLEDSGGSVSYNTLPSVNYYSGLLSQNNPSHHPSSSHVPVVSDSRGQSEDGVQQGVSVGDAQYTGSLVSGPVPHAAQSSIPGDVRGADRVSASTVLREPDTSQVPHTGDRIYGSYSAPIVGRGGGLVVGYGKERDVAIATDLADKYLSKGGYVYMKEASSAAVPSYSANTAPSTAAAPVLSYSVLLEQDAARLDAAASAWTFTLKQNILEELKRARLDIYEYHQKELNREKEKYAAEVLSVRREQEHERDLMRRYEQSLERKDETIASMTSLIERHRERLDVQRAFCDWRVKHVDLRRMEFTTKLARKHYERTLLRRALTEWKCFLESRWRERVDKACQRRAQQICINLTNEYEEKIASLNKTLVESRDEVVRLQREREKYEEEMKKAFMRGVCALNLEAMNVFSSDPQPTPPTSLINGDSSEDRSSRDLGGGGAMSGGREVSGEIGGGPVGGALDLITCSHEYKYHTSHSGLPTSLSCNNTTTIAAVRKYAESSFPLRQDSSKSRAVSVSKGHQQQKKFSGRVDTGLTQLSLPHNSVVIEKHQPIHKDVSQMMAAHYTRTAAASQRSVRSSHTGSAASNASNSKYQPIKVLQS